MHLTFQATVCPSLTPQGVGVAPCEQFHWAGRHQQDLGPLWHWAYLLPVWHRNMANITNINSASTGYYLHLRGPLSQRSVWCYGCVCRSVSHWPQTLPIISRYTLSWWNFFFPIFSLVKILPRESMPNGLFWRIYLKGCDCEKTLLKDILKRQHLNFWMM